MNTIAVINRSRSARSYFSKISASLPLAFPVIEVVKTKPAGYLAALAHEVRNPLCNINLACEMLSATILDEEQRTYLDIIMRGSGRINGLVNTLLKTEEAGEAGCTLYSVQQLIEEVLDTTKDRILLKQVTVSREFAVTGFQVLVDIEQMKIAITNIVINAIDSMSLGNGKLNLVIKTFVEKISIEIHDNGVGISKMNLERIFEPFYTNKLNGMGLGLSATLDILKANHVGVSVRSEVGSGSCFTLSFDRSPSMVHKSSNIDRLLSLSALK